MSLYIRAVKLAGAGWMHHTLAMNPPGLAKGENGGDHYVTMRV